MMMMIERQDVGNIEQLAFRRLFCTGRQSSASKIPGRDLREPQVCDDRRLVER